MIFIIKTFTYIQGFFHNSLKIFYILQVIAKVFGKIRCFEIFFFLLLSVAKKKEFQTSV